MADVRLDDEVLADRPDLTEPSELPAHARIGYWLERLIVSRRLQPGDRLPGEVDIAHALGVSRMTLRQALAGVEAKGLLERRRGRYGGNFVTSPRIDFHLAGLPGFTEQMRRAHVEAGAQLVRVTSRAATGEIGVALGLRRGEHVHEVIRVRSANGEPITLEETYLPVRVFPDLLDHDLTDSIYRVMQREYSREPFSAEEEIQPVKATPQQAELLKVRPDDPLLLVVRTGYAADGLPVEFAYDYFRPDRTRIRLRTRVDHDSAPTVDVVGATGRS